MTREEADAAIRRSGVEFGRYLTADHVMAMLKALGLLKVETPEKAAIDRLVSMIIETERGGVKVMSVITLDGAAEIIDILTKHGFRITRDET